MGKRKPVLFLFALEILAAASYIWHHIVSAFIGWDISWRFLHILLALALLAVLAAGMTKLLEFLSEKAAQRFTISSPDIYPAAVISLSPLLFLFLIYLPYFLFLRDIRGLLLPVSLLGSVFLIVIFYSRLKSDSPAYAARTESRGTQNRMRDPLTPPLRLFFFIPLFVYVTLASGVIFPPQPVTGDEPHYLIITQSLLKDGDINLHNNYHDRDYLAFYPGDLEPHAYQGKRGDLFLYSKHFPALPVLLVPAYYLGEIVGRQVADGPDQLQLRRRVLVFCSRLPLCLLMALFGVLFFLVVFDITQRRGVSVLAWALFCFTIPIIFYSHLIYAEIPAALITLFVIRNGVLKRVTKTWPLFLTGAGIALLPWFGLKFLVLSAALFCVSAAALVHKKSLPQLRRSALPFLAPILVSAVSYIGFFWALYGNLSPVSAYKGVSPEQANPYAFESLALFASEALRRFFGYFIDQKFGLFIYAPLFLLGIAGFYFLYKKGRREAFSLMAVLTVYALFSAGFYWGGHCPPPRPIIPVLCIWGLFMAAALAERPSQFRTITTTVLGFLSLLIAWASLPNPRLLYPEQYANRFGGEILYAKLFRGLSNTFVPVHTWFPSLTWEAALDWPPIFFWSVVLALLTVLFIKKAGDRKSEAKPSPPRMIVHACVVSVLTILVLLYAFFNIHLDQKTVFAEKDYELYFQDENHFGAEVGGFWTRGSRPATVILKTAQPLTAIQVRLTSPVEGRATVHVGPHWQTVTRTEQTGFTREADFALPQGFPLEGARLYTITIKDSTGFIPNRLDSHSADSRRLGVFVRINTR